MSQIHLIRNGGETAYSKPIKRALLRDVRLSYGARGLFAMLWDFPTNWTFYLAFIVEMSPGGMFQLKTYIKELKQYGAMSITPKRLTLEEAVQKSYSGAKHFRAGQINGWQWVLNHPDTWAIETPLARINLGVISTSPKDRFPALRESRQLVKPLGGKSAAKVLQQQGFTNTRPPLHNKAVEENPIALDFVKTNAFSIDSSAGVEYFYPKQLGVKERVLAKVQLDSIEPTLAQEILDELAARLNANKITSSPLSYLRALTARANAGQFTPEAGVRVALAREQAPQIRKDAQVVKSSNSASLRKNISAMHRALCPKSIANI